MIRLKFLLILISFLIFKPLLAEESWYQTAANLHKKVTNWGKKKHKGKKRNVCYFKFGLYANANLKAEHKHEAEGMAVFTDYMAMAKTEEKLETLLLKDK